MMRSEMRSPEALAEKAVAIPPDAVPPQDGTACPYVREVIAPPFTARPETKPADEAQHSGILHRPIDEIRRPAVTSETAVTELEKYKLALRKFAPVQKGRAALPWRGQWHCVPCNRCVPGQLAYDERDDAMYLETACPKCGPRRESALVKWSER